MVSRIMVFSNKTRDIDLACAKRVISFLLEKGCAVCVNQENAELTEWDSRVVPASYSVLKETQLAIVMGGDGTMISAGHYLLGMDIPLIGINLGHLGYMMEIEPDDVEEALAQLIEGSFTVEKRMMLEAMVVDKENGIDHHFYAINDFLIHRGARDGLIRVHAYQEKEPLTDFVSDGVIVSSPSGSTAYNFSAGGPIVSPVADNIIVTPVCSHSMLDRSLVLPGSDELNFSVNVGRGETADFTSDGRNKVLIGAGAQISVKKSDSFFLLAKLGTKSFYQIMKLKMRP